MEPTNNPYNSYTDNEILELWDSTTNFEERNKLIVEVKRRDLFPSEFVKEWEYDTGSYPDLIDPEFLQKLLAKREFAESLQATWKPKTNPCEDVGTFEVTPVQRFVSNFMSPKTPYMSMLLYHGVGVGKTCAAIQITEAWLDIFPRQEVYLIIPPTIQEGFYRTIFDKTRVILGDGNQPNSASQCTGDKYMRLTNTLYERDINIIEKNVNKLIKKRYKIFGYIAFANYVKNLFKKIPEDISDEQKELLKKKYIRKFFNGRLVIVDEAHNLRDLPEGLSEETDDLPGGKAEKSDSAGGKQLTPYLKDVLKFSEGMKFTILTATPMYNTYREIIFVLNLLLLNDKKATIVESDIFDKDGNITSNGAILLSSISRRYISFMRGENPISFPIRLFPENINKSINYPKNNPRNIEIENESDIIFYDKLPIVPIELKGDILKGTLSLMNSILPGKGMSSIILSRLVHAGNIIMPPLDNTEINSESEAESESESNNSEDYVKRTESSALFDVFSKEYVGGEIRFKAKKEGGAQWLSEENIEQYSPKFKFLLDKLKNSEGVVFAYTRYVESGALPLSLFLEANGYSPYNRKSTLLVNGIQSPGGRQCALCKYREKNHSTITDHSFAPAYYGLLTGDILLSPKNADTIRAERDISNVNGINMKIIIGSQVASEGVDLRFIRETHVIDSWFHLSKTEQILGRAIRYMSHCALPQEKRNTTVYLYAAVLPPEYDRETGDLYSYRIGFKKAVQVGNVTRILKQSAIDCNLNNEAIIIRGQQPVKLIDSQRNIRSDVNINDMPFTAVCDWIETCDYKCTPFIDVKKLHIDDSTYDEYSSKWRVMQMKQRLQKLFSIQPFFRSEDLWNNLSDIPRLVVADLLSEIVNNTSFQIEYNNKKGYIRYCNGYYIFQPGVYDDLYIPLAIRAAKYPIKRDEYISQVFEMPELTEEEAAEEEKVTTENLENIWNSIYSWCNSLSMSSNYVNIPYEINARIIDMSHNDYELMEKYKQTLEMVLWFHKSYNKSNNKNSVAFRKALIQYFWDNWFSIEEQKYLIYSTNANVSECISNEQYALGKLIVNRFIDTKTGEIKYFCENGQQCTTAIIDEIERDSDDLMKRTKVNSNTTGQIYGFIVPKNGELVFKTNEPPRGEEDKIGRGQECANVSTMTGHIQKLSNIGSLLREAQLTDFDLRKDILMSTRKVKNSIRACTLMEIVIRYVDQIRAYNKRWFFRSIEAFYTGHKGLFRPGRRV